MAILRTKILLFVFSAVLVNCDKDLKLRDPEDIAVPDSALALLRGAETKPENTEDDTFTPNQTAIEPERVFLETEIDYDNRSEYEENHNPPDKVTTEATTIADDKAGKSENDKKDVKIDADHPSTIADRVEETTLSTIDNNVYRHRDKVEDIYNSSSIEDAQVETTIAPTTSTPLTKDETPAKDDDPNGQRNPKTENSAVKPPIDKRNNAPAPLPQASKSSTLKGWLEDSWLRPPAGILVPLRPMALNRALAVWNDLTAAEGLDVNDIVIIGYDSNGVSWRSRHNLQSSSHRNGKNDVSEELSKLLLKYQGIHTDASADGTMRALSSATKLVPYDSALFVVTDKGAGDPQRLPLALRALVEKRLKVYTIWTDPAHPSQESELELQQLKNISRQTEGDVLPYSLQVMDIEGSINSAEDNWHQIEYVQPRRARLYSKITRDNYDTLLVRRGGGGAISLGVPVENGVSALRVHIEGAVEHAVLYPPNDGPQIDLYNQTSVVAFSTTSKTDGNSPRDVFLGFPGADLNGDLLSVLPMSKNNGVPAPTVGLWHLSIRCDTCDYRLCISARARIHFDAEVHGDMLHLRVTGSVASVRESTLIDEYGTELSKLPFSYQPKAGDAQEEVPDGTDAELATDVALPNVKGSRVYVKIVGRDVRGEPFVRYAGPIYEHSEVRLSRSASPNYETDLDRAEEANLRAYNSRLQYNNSNILSNDRAASQVVNQQGTILTSVQIGLSTRLYGAPGDNLQLHFEVTNYRNQAVQFAFEAVGELRFLRGINPARQLIGAGQTANVIVSVGITATAQPGARDLITFTAYSANTEQVTISAYVYVVNPDFNPADVWSPEVRHNFQGSCLGRMGSDCATHVWSSTIIARDGVGGLLRLASSPVGLLYDSNFISGTREEVMATYRATCCAPRVMVTAIDTYGNANSYVVDITNYFTEAAIAAIVLGVFLVIIIIVLIAFLIYWCVKRSKESRELPTYSTSRSRSLG